ncbi:MAG: lipid-A-disaccharide synthase [Bacteroidia bacterium]|nr:lipid-A-disaccharide synthase [Bacteroidia bacterium]
MTQKWYFIAGEDSGDLLASHLIKAMKSLNPEIQVKGMGGDKMQSEGMQLTEHIRNTSFMGFWEVFKNLLTIRKLFTKIKASILDFQPDVVVLVDYPGFNLRMAKWLHKKGIRVFYYISPQLWAWKKGRIQIIRDYVEKLYVILPFEKNFYESEGIEVEYYGHPLLDVKATFDAMNAPVSGLNQIALLPGSRTQEIKKILPVMLEVAASTPEMHFVIAGAPSKNIEFYRQFPMSENVEIQMNKTYSVLASSRSALVTSGTATLESALFMVPQVVCYKGSSLSFLIAKRLVKVPFISLVNLISGKETVKELIQDELTPENLKTELLKITEGNHRTEILRNYQELHQKLGEAGVSLKIAAAMLNRANTPPPGK